MDANTVVKWTPTQERILAMLGDGKAHRTKALLACLGDELAGMRVLSSHIAMLNKLLRPIGQEIICRFMYGSYHYQHVNLRYPD